MVLSFMEAALPTSLTVLALAAVLRCQPEKVYRLAAPGELRPWETTHEVTIVSFLPRLMHRTRG